MANQHIVPDDKGWAVHGAGNSKDTVHLNTQLQAIERARQILQNQGGGELVIHGANGKIRAKDTIDRTDYFPPRG
ncbi:MAG: DUF2188 domain-containing protein [Candidatus Woesebacteria bacterium]|nr:DUF2188 domain-containing protein [Candidatus Woesebacteria bacterium]